MKIIAIKNRKTKQADLPSNFPVWLHQQILEKTNNFKTPVPLNEEQIETLREWAENIRPNLFGLDLSTAYAQANTWYQLQLTKQYKNNKPVFKWTNGWKIVQIPLSEWSSRTDPKEHMSDLEIERELMETEDGEYKNFYNQYSYFEDTVNKPEKDMDLIIYSLRDPQNIPRATIEIRFVKNNPQLLYVHEIFTNEALEEVNYEKLHARRNYIKEFFTYLKSQGYQFGTVEGGGSDDIKANKLDEYEWEDQFGLPYELWGVGGSAENYYDGLLEAYEEGNAGSYWYKGSATKVVDNLIAYAEERNELSLLEKALEGYSEKGKDKNGKEITIYKGLDNTILEWWEMSNDSSSYEHPYPIDEPDKKDFMIPPDTTIQQGEFQNMPPAQPKFDKKAYEEAVKEYNLALEAHEEERSRAEEYFEPNIFRNYVYEELQKAKARQSQKPQKIQKKVKTNDMKTKIIKHADKIEERLPDGEQMALYVQTLKQYLRDEPSISEEWKELIRQLPSPRKVKQDFSLQEMKLLYETIEYLWEKIAKQRIISEKEIIKSPEKLMGNYLMIANGILLKGVNVHDIVRRNTALLCSLLNISGMTMQEYISGRPNELVKFIIKNGALRLFITKDGRFYSQCSPATYGNWARKKIQKLDFKKKIVKLIDLRAEYRGWSSGICVIL